MIVHNIIVMSIIIRGKTIVVAVVVVKPIVVTKNVDGEITTVTCLCKITIIVTINYNL